jgi:hypothetical protein
MAGEYKNSIIANIQSFFGFANQSASALWYRIATFASDIIDIINIELSNTETIISDAALNHRVLNQSYYVDIAKEYQEGVDLIEIDTTLHKLGYAQIDTSKQIIKQASVSIQDKFITLNVATTDSNNNLIPLTPDQLSSFSSYFENFTAFGLPVNIKSEEADVIEIDSSQNLISYDSVISLDQLKQNISDKLDEIEQNVILGNTYYINDIVSQLMEVDGVINVYIGSVKITADSSTTTTSNKINLVSGYFNFKEGTQNTFKYEAVS